LKSAGGELREAIYIAGATASGKSAVAMALARRVEGEIISVDSMQVYRGMDIGTAKPSEAERREVPHHLLDIAELSETFDAARFLVAAEAAEKGIRERGKVPIYCGGTGLYFKAMVSGIGSAPPANASVREELVQTASGELLRELEERDPQTFQNIDRQNLRRVIRALEVIRITGKPFSEFKSDWTVPQQGRWFGLERPREELNGRINARVEEMFRKGLVEETGRLLERGLEKNPTAMQAIGYRQVVDHLQGKVSLPETIELVKVKTRQYAKRQATWFKRQLKLEWLVVERENSAEEIAAEILRRISLPPQSGRSQADLRD